MGQRHISFAGITAIILAISPAAAMSAADAARLAADRGHAMEAQGDHAGAIAAFSEAIADRSLPAAEQARLLFDRGLVLDGQGRLDEAAADYSAALTLQPGFSPALNNRANVYRRQGRLADAGKDYRASLAAGNEAPEYSWYGLGAVSEAEGNSIQARLYYDRALSANPAFSPAAESLAALGGTPPAAGEIIHLKAPPRAPDGGGRAISLKPPALSAKRPSLRERRAATASRNGGAEPLLRPALYGSPAPSKSLVQLGAWRSAEEAKAGWQKARTRAGRLLDGLSPHVVAVDIPGRGRFFRLQAGPAPEGGQFCVQLQAAGQGCIPARE